MPQLPHLRTNRLMLRPFVPGDGPEVERLAGTREVADATLTVPHPYPPGAGAEWIATHAESWDRQERLSLAITHGDSSGTLIGAVALHISARHAHGEIGYWIAVDSWGKGYATEAASAVMAYAFDVLQLHRVQGQHFCRNPASGRVLQKLGMTLEGIHRHAYRRWGVFEDVAMYAVLQTDRESPSSS